MTRRRGRSVDEILSRLPEPDGPIVLADQVKRATSASLRRVRSSTPEERLDRAFALISFARSMGERDGGRA